MQGVLLGFLLIWGFSFLIFAWMIWRAPVMEEIVEEGEQPAALRQVGSKQTA